MTIYLTGSSGFLGKYLYNSLSNGNIVTTIGRTNQDILIDLTKNTIKLELYDLVIHAAGLAHKTSRTIEDDKNFYETNVQGTINLLNSLNDHPPKYFVFISSVSVYGIDCGKDINESHSTKPNEPYGLSKLKAEKLIQDWCVKNNVIYTILRLPLVIGNNPKGNLAKLIRGIKYGYFFNISNGIAKKSMVLAEDIANHILICSQVGGIYNLTDGYHPSFKDLTKLLAIQLNKRAPLNFPYLIAFIFAKFGDIIPFKFPFNSKILYKVTSDLTFDDSLARNNLNWKPRSVINSFKYEQ